MAGILNRSFLIRLLWSMLPSLEHRGRTAQGVRAYSVDGSRNTGKLADLDHPSHLLQTDTPKHSGRREYSMTLT